MKKILALILVVALSLTFLVGCEGDTGPKGATGSTGVSIVDADVNSAGHLILSLSDGTDIDAGYVIGPIGSRGVTGATGVQGPAGTLGSIWITGYYPPVSTIGAVNDWYLDSTTYNVFHKTAVNVWTLVCNIKGLTGVTGATGVTGTTGATGAKGDKGDKGNTGDTGPAGPTGPQGIQGEQGPQGVQGEPGPQGIQGEQGPAGTFPYAIQMSTCILSSPWPASQVITFSAPFTGTPLVFVSVTSPSDKAINFSAVAVDITATGFTLKVNYFGGPSPATCAVCWLAIY